MTELNWIKLHQIKFTLNQNPVNQQMFLFPSRSSAQSSDGNMGLEAMGSPAEDLVGADISSGKGG